MIDFIPLEYYSIIYYNVLLIFFLVTFLLTRTLPEHSRFNIQALSRLGYILLLFVLLYLGLRPISGVFVDMTTYARIFENFKAGADNFRTFDFLYFDLTWLMAQMINVKTFFFINLCLYLIPLFIVARDFFEEFWFIAFLMLVGSFSFYAYGTNGLRNGIAGSIFLLGLSREKKFWQFFWITISIGFHFSMLLPAAGFLLAMVYNKPKQMVLFWLICIPLSLVLPGYWENIFAGLGFDHRLEFLVTQGIDRATKAGFRWDFLLYSSTAVISGWYYIVKKGYEDKTYYLIYNTYVFSNAIWILVIRANFSNRFAYLSWFMMAIVIIYPLIREYILNNQYKKMGYILLAYFTFTYVMEVIL